MKIAAISQFKKFKVKFWPSGWLGSTGKVVMFILFFILVPNIGLAAPAMTEYKLNSGSSDVRLNPSRGDTVAISLTADTAVKFNTIALCLTTDATCSRTTAAKYFSQTNSYSTAVSKVWDGKKSSGEAVDAGDYKVKVTMAVEGVAETSFVELSLPLIIVDPSYTGGAGDDGTDGEDDGGSDIGNEAGGNPAGGNSDSSSGSSASSYSAHNSPTAAKVSKVAKTSELSAGRPRLAVVNSPVTFEVPELSKFAVAKLKWSFGDGVSVRGRKAEHIYRQPGDYVVVLNAKSDEGEEVARTTVKVIPATFTINCATSKEFNITNSGAYEMNLGGWRLKQEQNNFTIAIDTILLPGSTLIFDSTLLGFTINTENYIEFVAPNGAVAGGCRGGQPLVNSNKADLVPKIEIDSETEIVVEKLATTKETIVKEVEEVEEPADSKIIATKKITQTASASQAGEVLVLKRPSGNFFSRILNWPSTVKRAVVDLIR
ncbi:MAG: hypothetical protein A2571_01240 [Candidatus Vogelbacteria bacterium RIFOXYD1_FULL_44_32]|uniref:PKD domain-containing protein n=1 Tax=Candidatus Vogelbacteria bacterium RIFOXYD1_FULL_44_32 TaxID=1802438 RepID=A0A1G2QEJ1_9BACT|nr:MAG: hypothetical protein A2571_01240 [Candidatus Vogelbacteria bacterium RIFOXYD1_FULL_44_32]